MPYTSSISFPNMFNVANSTVSVLEDSASIINRTRLLLLTEPTELYNSPDFGSGLKRHLWKYNTQNEIAIIKDRIKIQLSKYEPFVDAESTIFNDEAKSIDDAGYISSPLDSGSLKMTISLCTTFDQNVKVDLGDLQSIIDNLST